MTSSGTLSCSSCNALVTPEDLVQGLAVRVDGKPICAMCVDLLPGKAQVAINKMRALKGLNATTYRVEVPRHPDHLRFTFTTAGNILGHRRSLKATGDFAAPLLPAGERPPEPPRSPSTSTHPAAGPRRRRPVAVIAAAVAALVVVGAIGASFTMSKRGTAPRDASARPPTRADYPSDPGEAWLSCVSDRACPPALLEQVRQELRQARATVLDQAASELDAGHLERAHAALEQVHLPDEAGFSDLRARARDLSARLLAAQPARTAATIAPQVEAPAGAEQQPQAKPVAAEPRVIQAPVAPEATDGPGRECWVFTADDLMAGREVPYWRAGGDLTGLYGTLLRELPAMAGGQYQVWLEAGNAKKRGTLTVLVDGKAVGKLDGDDCAEVAWRPLRAALDLTAGTHIFAIKASGAGWHISRAYLADTGRPVPNVAGALAVSPWAAPAEPAAAPTEPPPKTDGASTATPTTATTAATQPTPPSAASKPIKPPERQVAAWTRVFSWPAQPKDEPLDGTVAIPSPWPSGAEPFLRSQRPTGSKQPQSITLELTKGTVDGGGVVLLLNRARADRRALVATLGYAQATTTVAQVPRTNHVTGAAEVDERIEDRLDREVLPLPAIDFADTGDWQVFPIAFPDLSRCGGKLWLKLEDANADISADRGFLLGKVVTVAHAEPSATDLGLMSSPLIAPDVIAQKDYQRRLVSVLAQVAPKRSGRKWNDLRGFDPRKAKLLVTNADKGWETEMRRQLARILGAKEAPKGAIENLALADGWYAEKQFKGAQPFIDPDEATLAVVCLNGEEGGCSLKDPEALEKWVRALIGQLVDGDARGKRGGFLPVLVVGRTTKVDDPALQQAIDLAWMKVRDDCQASGFPLIDIRGAQTEKGKGDTKALSAQLLADGLRALQYQIAWAQRFVR
jgi:hypothetical protein